MSFRFLLSVLPVALAPFGVLGESAGLELQREVVEAAEWRVGVSTSVPDGRLVTPPPSDEGGDGSSGSPFRPASGLLPGAPAPAGCAAPAILLSDHLRRCGHDAGRLDLPPPPRA